MEENKEKVESVQEVNSEEEAQLELEKRLEEKINELMEKKGMTRRQAKRYLILFARKQTRKLIKEGKRRRRKLEAEGKLIDTSDIREQLDKELEEALKNREQVLSVGYEYESPTNDF